MKLEKQSNMITSCRLRQNLWSDTWKTSDTLQQTYGITCSIGGSLPVIPAVCMQTGSLARLFITRLIARLEVDM